MNVNRVMGAKDGRFYHPPMGNFMYQNVGGGMDNNPIKSADSMLRTFIRYAAERSNGEMAAQQVRQYIDSLLRGTLDVHSFIKKIDDLFGNTMQQPKLTSYLEKALPHVRTAIAKGQLGHLLLPPNLPPGDWNYTSNFPDFPRTNDEPVYFLSGAHNTTAPMMPMNRQLNQRPFDVPVSLRSISRNIDVAGSSFNFVNPPNRAVPSAERMDFSTNRPNNFSAPSFERPKTPTFRAEPLVSNTIIPPPIAPVIPPPPKKNEIELAKQHFFVDPTIFAQILTDSGLKVDEKVQNEILDHLTNILKVRIQKIFESLDFVMKGRRLPPPGNMEIIRDPLKELRILDRFYRREEESRLGDFYEQNSAEAKAANKKLEEERRREDVNAAAMAALGRRPAIKEKTPDRPVNVRITVNDLIDVFEMDSYISRTDFYKKLLIYPNCVKYRRFGI
uniref:TAFH domain-containing protein n=1 Tax=Panagrolaimus sp. JU765 TaxID=591449 RepID=A0AC34QDJ5_9BILA